VGVVELEPPLPLAELLAVEVWATGLTFVILPLTTFPFGICTVTGSPTLASLCLVASRSTETMTFVEAV
jgi:hypothetical protein